MSWQRAIFAISLGAYALAVSSAARADPDSAFFSQRLAAQQNQQQQGPWAGSQVNVEQYSTLAGGGTNIQAESLPPNVLGAVVNLSSVVPGQTIQRVPGVVTEFSDTFSKVFGGLGGTNSVGGLATSGGAGGISPGAISASATGSALGALGALGH
jgi:hypothetical protein